MPSRLGLPRLGFLPTFRRDRPSRRNRGPPKHPHAIRCQGDCRAGRTAANCCAATSRVIPGPGRSARPRRQTGRRRSLSSCAATECDACAGAFPTPASAARHAPSTRRPPPVRQHASRVRPIYSQHRDDVVGPRISGDDGLGLGDQLLGRRCGRPPTSTPPHVPIVFWRLPIPSPAPAPGLRRDAARVRLRTAARSRRRICRRPWPRPPAVGRRIRCRRRAVDGTEHPLPQRNRPHVQVVVAQRGRAQYLRVGEQVRVLVGQFGETRRRPRSTRPAPSRRLRDRPAPRPGRCAGTGLAANTGRSCARRRRPTSSPGRPLPAWSRPQSRSRSPDSRGCAGCTRALRHSRLERGRSRPAGRRLPASGRRDLPARSRAPGTATDPGRRSRRRPTPGGGPALIRRRSTRLHHKSLCRGSAPDSPVRRTCE